MVIAMSNKLTAPSKPAVILLRLAYVWLYADVDEPVGAVGTSCPLTVQMMYATTIRPTKAIPIIKTTPRSTMARASSDSFLKLYIEKGLVFQLVFIGVDTINFHIPLWNFHIHSLYIWNLRFRLIFIETLSGSGRGIT